MSSVMVNGHTSPFIEDVELRSRLAPKGFCKGCRDQSLPILLNFEQRYYSRTTFSILKMYILFVVISPPYLMIYVLYY